MFLDDRLCFASPASCIYLIISFSVTISITSNIMLKILSETGDP